MPSTVAIQAALYSWLSTIESVLKSKVLGNSTAEAVRDAKNRIIVIRVFINGKFMKIISLLYCRVNNI